MVSGDIGFYEGDFTIDGNTTFGGALGFEIAKNTLVELTFSNTVTDAHFIPRVSGYLPWNGKIGINYLMIGSVKEFYFGESPVVPYFGGELGTSITNVKESTVSDLWRFSIALKGGLKIFLSDAIGIKLQARMLMPLYFAGVGFYGGIGTGGSSAGLSLNGGVVVLQGDFTAGLVFRFNK